MSLAQRNMRELWTQPYSRTDVLCWKSKIWGTREILALRVIPPHSPFLDPANTPYPFSPQEMVKTRATRNNIYLEGMKPSFIQCECFLGKPIHWKRPPYSFESSGLGWGQHTFKEVLTLKDQLCTCTALGVGASLNFAHCPPPRWAVALSSRELLVANTAQKGLQVTPGNRLGSFQNYGSHNPYNLSKDKFSPSVTLAREVWELNAVWRQPLTGPTGRPFPNQGRRGLVLIDCIWWSFVYSLMLSNSRSVLSPPRALELEEKDRVNGPRGSSEAKSLPS